MKRVIRVEIPRNADELLKLASLVLAKHTELGAASPLKSVNMADMNIKFTESSYNNNKADEYRRLSEQSTELRDKGIGRAQGQNSATDGTLLYYITAIRDILLGVNRGKEHRLGEFGFDVSTTPRKSDEPEEPDKA